MSKAGDCRANVTRFYLRIDPILRGKYQGFYISRQIWQQQTAGKNCGDFTSWLSLQGGVEHVAGNWWIKSQSHRCSPGRGEGVLWLQMTGVF